MQCPNCSTENSDDSKFCMACGHALLQAAPPAEPVPATPAPAGTAPPPPVDTPAPPPPVDTPAPPPPVQPVAPVPVEAPPPPVESPLPPPVPEPGPEPGPPTGDAASNPWLADTAGPAAAAESSESPEPVAPVDPVAPPVTGAPTAPAASDDPALEPTPGSPDPHGLEAHVARLSEATRPYAEVPVLLASMVLDESETVIVVVPGLIDEVVGVAVVTDRRVLLVSGRRWKPIVVDLAIAPGLTVDGWQDAQSAMLTFHGDRTARIAGIVDKPLAFEAAGVVRDRVAAM